MLLAINIVFIAALGTVMLGTLYPLFLDALGLGKISVGPPYFEAVFVPLMAPLVFLMGIGPLSAWRKASLPDLATRLKWAFGAAIVTAMALPFILGRWTPLIALGVLLSAWVAGSTIVALLQRVRASPQRGVVAKLRAHPRAWNGAWGVRMYVKPFVDWIWFGCLLMAVGGFLAISDRRYRLTVKERFAAMVRAAQAA